MELRFITAGPNSKYFPLNTTHMTNEEKINLIGQKMLILSNNLDKYQSELAQLRQQLEALQAQQGIRQQIVPPVMNKPEPVIEQKPEIKEEITEKKQEVREEIAVVNTQETIKPVQQQYIPPVKKPQKEFNFEEFIGGKLITIIGIVILVIGFGVGGK